MSPFTFLPRNHRVSSQDDAGRDHCILAKSIVALAAYTVCTFTSAEGAIFSTSGLLGMGDESANVGLSGAKTYLEAVDLGDTTNTMVNGVLFTGSGASVAPFGTGWAITGTTNLFGGGNPVPAGDLGTLTNRFVYGGNPATLTLSGLGVGQTYVLTLYNRSWESAGQRVQNIVASGASSATTVFDEDIGAAGQGELNLLRYTFQANSATQTLAITPQNLGNTMHLYAFTTEQTFNNLWTSGATWTNAAWSVAQPDGAGSNATFGAQSSPRTITLDADRTVGHVQFEGTNAWTLSGVSTLTLQADVGGVSVLGALAGSHTISTPITLANDVVKLGSGSLMLSGAVAGFGAVNVQGGTLTLGTANSYSGGTRVDASATLRLGAAGALGLASAPLTVNAGGALDLKGSSQSVGSLSGAGTIANDASGTNAVLTIGTGDTGGGTFAGVLADHSTGTGTLALTKVDLATLTLSGANSYSGATTISGGRLELNGSAAAGTLNTSAISVAAGSVIGFTAGTGSTLTMKGGSTFSLGGGALALDLGSAVASDKLVGDTFVLTANSALAFTPVSGLNIGSTYTLATYTTLLNPGAFTLAGTTAGRLALNPVIEAKAITLVPTLDSATWNSATGGAWSAGPWTGYTPVVAGDSAVFGPTLTTNGTVTVDFPLSVGYLTFNNGAASYTIGTSGSGNLALDNGAASVLVTVNAGAHTIAENLTLASNALFSTDPGTSLIAQGVVGGAGSLRKSGGGLLIVTAGNTYSGGTTIGEGTLQLGDGTTNGSVAGDITNNATLVFHNGAAQTYGGAIGGAGSVTKLGPQTLTLTGTNNFTGGMTISAGTVDVGGNTGTGSVAGTIVNNATLRFSRTGGSTISNVVNGTGTTIITGGGTQMLSAGAAINTPTVSVGDTLQGYVFFGAPNQLNGTTGNVLNIGAHASNSRINLNGFNQTLAGLTGVGIVQNHETVATTAAATLTLNVPGTNSFSWSGLIRNQAGGPLSLVKTGTGEQTMIFSVSNGAGSYTGATTIDQGRLTFGSTYAAPIWGTSGINIAAGAELGLTGAGAGVVSWGTNGRVISGAGGVTRLGTGTNTVTITNGTNSYTGPTALKGTGSLAVGTLANIATNSSIGAGDGTSATTNAASLLFDGGTLLYTGGVTSTNRLFTLTQNGGRIDSSGTGAIAFNNPGAIITNGSGARTLTLAGSNAIGSNTLAGAIGNGAGGVTSIVKTGVGTWVLSGANSYSGSTTLTGGRLQLEGSAVNSAVASVTAFAGTTFGFGSNAANTLTVSGGLTLGTGTVLFDLGSAAASDRINAGALTLTGNPAFSFNQIGIYDVGTNYTLASYGTLNNAGGFSVNGFQAGRLTLNPVVGANAITLMPQLDNAAWNNPAGGNWSSGPWTGYTPNAVGDAALLGTALTSSGTIVVDTPRTVGYLTFNNGAASYTLGAVGSGNLTLANAGNAPVQVVVSAGNHTIAESVTLASDAIVLTVAGTSITFSGGLNGVEKSLTKNGAGRLTLGGFNDFGTVPGALNINDGTVVSGSATALAAGTAVAMNGGKLDLNGHDTQIGLLSGTAGTITDDAVTPGVTTLTIDQASSSTFSGSIADGIARVLAFNKRSAGNLTLGRANSFSGGLIVSSGALIAASSSGQSVPGAVTLGDGSGGNVWLISGASAQQYGADAVITWNNFGADAKFELRGTNQTVAGLDSTTAQSLSIIQNDETTAPGFTVAPGPATLTFNTSTDHSFYGLIRDQTGGPLSFVKNGPGVQEFINRPDLVGISYTGTTTINAGKLVLNLSGTTGGLFASNVAVNSGGTLGLDGAWTLSRPVTGAGNVVKQGLNTVTVSSVLSHTGNTIVETGTLVLTSSLSGSANLFVESSAILDVSGVGAGFVVAAGQTLKGDGTVLGPLTVSGTLAPGSTIGTLTTDALTLGSGSTFALEINTSTITTDNVLVNGTFSLSQGVAPTLSITDLGGNVALPIGTRFTFVSYSGGWNGRLFRYGGSPMPDDSVLAFGVNDYRLDYNAAGNSVALTVVPEPVTSLTLFGAAAGFLGFRRFRRERRP